MPAVRGLGQSAPLWAKVRSVKGGAWARQRPRATGDLGPVCSGGRNTIPQRLGETKSPPPGWGPALGQPRLFLEPGPRTSLELATRSPRGDSADVLRPPPGPPHAPAWPRLVPATPIPSTSPPPTPMGSRGVCGLQGPREVASLQVPQQSWSPRFQGLLSGTSWHHPQKPPSWAQGPSRWLRLCGSNKKMQGWLGHGGHPLATSSRRARSPGTLPLTPESRRPGHLRGLWEAEMSGPREP